MSRKQHKFPGQQALAASFLVETHSRDLLGTFMAEGYTQRPPANAVSITDRQAVMKDGKDIEFYIKDNDPLGSLFALKAQPEREGIIFREAYYDRKTGLSRYADAVRLPWDGEQSSEDYIREWQSAVRSEPNEHRVLDKNPASGFRFD